MLEGQTDLRTPLEDAEALAARLPDARVLRAPGVGHSVISSTFSSCPERALGAFFAGRGVRRACPPDPILSAPPDPLPPRRLSRVAPLRGVAGRRGRTAAAALLTVEDLGPALLGALAESGEDILSGPLAAGGLRGGFYRFTQSGLRLHHVVYVPGVVVSGLVRATGRPGSVRARLSVRGSAAAPGSVNISPSGAVSGTLAGRRYRARPAVAAAASMADPRAALDRARRVAQLLRETTIPAPGVRAGSGGSRAAAAQRRR
jgi:hypothetical protein